MQRSRFENIEESSTNIDHTCTKDIPMAHVSPTNWMEEFDKKTKHMKLHLGYGWQTRIADLKSFIQDQIEAERDRCLAAHSSQIPFIQERARKEGFISGRQSGYAEAIDYGREQGRDEEGDRIVKMIENGMCRIARVEDPNEALGMIHAYENILANLKSNE